MKRIENPDFIKHSITEKPKYKQPVLVKYKKEDILDPTEHIMYTIANFYKKGDYAICEAPLTKGMTPEMMLWQAALGGGAYQLIGEDGFYQEVMFSPAAGSTYLKLENNEIECWYELPQEYEPETEEEIKEFWEDI